MSVINQVLQDLDRRQGAWNLVPEGVMVGAQPEMQFAAPTGAMHAAAFDAAAMPVSRDSLAAPTFAERLNRRWARLQAEPTQRLHLALVASAVVIGSSLAGAGLMRNRDTDASIGETRMASAGTVAAAVPTPVQHAQPKPAEKLAATPAPAAAATSAANIANAKTDINASATAGTVTQVAAVAHATATAIATASASAATALPTSPAKVSVPTQTPATVAPTAGLNTAVAQAAGAAALPALSPASATPSLARSKAAKPTPSTAQAQTQVAAVSGALAEAASAKPRTAASAAPALAAAPAAVVATATTARNAGDTGSIDKRDRQQAPRERADAEHQRGLALQQQGQSAEANAAFAAALRADKTHVPARQVLALALFQQHQNAEAEALLAEGLALQPQQASLAMLLSRFKLDHQDLTGAIEVLKNALPSEGGSAEARGLLAAQLQRANQHGEAAEQFALALRQNPSHGVWWMGLGISLAADGRNAAAREAFQRARYASGLSAELQSYVEQRLKGL
ncbi:MAG: hypothetical protein RJA98_508 [Pseudomonadota bacterium]|jgi:MSHA biogenesis protein MshN